MTGKKTIIPGRPRLTKFLLAVQKDHQESKYLKLRLIGDYMSLDIDNTAFHSEIGPAQIQAAEQAVS